MRRIPSVTLVGGSIEGQGGWIQKTPLSTTEALKTGYTTGR